MIVGLILAGSIAGLIAGVSTLISGGGFALALLLYSAVGMGTLVSLAVAARALAVVRRTPETNRAHSPRHA